MDKILALVEHLGWKIFPVHSIIDGRCTCGRTPGDKCSPGKHPRIPNGVKGASSDPAAIQRWAATWPETNWGLATGRTSGVLVIDIDQKSGGYESINNYEEMQGALPQTVTSLTGGGGKHLFFKYPDHISQGIINSVNWLNMSGVDVRSDGGYVLLPPGTHISGGTYRWDPNGAKEFASLPDNVIEDLLAKKVAKTGGPDFRDFESMMKHGIPEGARDDTLFKMACRQRRQLGGEPDGGRFLVTKNILDVAEISGFPREEALKCVEQAFRQDHSDPIKDGTLLPLTEVGCRDRFIREYGDDYRYVPEYGWFTWTSRGWRFLDQAEDLTYKMESVATILIEESESVMDKNILKDYDYWIKKMSSSSGINAVEGLLKNSPAIRLRLDDFDKNPYELACLNGIVDLRTGEIRPFSRQDLVTKNTGVNYIPQAKSKLWEDFLGVSVQGDTELLEYLHLAAGYTATGEVTDESFFVISGPGASGKSTYMGALQAALGSYSVTTQADTFMYRRGKQPDNEIARLAGARMTCISEIREGDSFNDALVKQVVSGDRVTGRFLYKNTFEFTPQFKLWIATNHDPASTDDPLLRRLKRINFSHAVPKAERDPNVKTDILTKEREAVLAWIIEGAKKFYATATGRLVEPASIISAVAAYKEEQDITAMFLDDVILKSEGSVVKYIDLFRTWVDWCDRLKIYAGKPATFKKQMTERGIQVGMDDNGSVFFKDIAVSVSAMSDKPWA